LNPDWSIAIQPSTNRKGLTVVPVAKNGGNPFAVEWMELRRVFGAR
jgi:hypothetical protein